MDVGFRGSYVAIGAAAFNARVAAAKHSIVGPITAFPADASSDGVTISLADGVDPELAALYPAMVKRMSNRSFGRREPLADPLAADLTLAARAEGARLTLISDGERLSRLAEVLAASDRVRYLTPLLHRQMMSELKWPGIDRLDAGIDVRTLGLDATDLAKLKVASRSEVMGYLARWNVGQALGDNTRDRVIGSSAMAVVTVNGDTPYDYFRGGSAVERVWIKASEAGLGVYPISPVFLYARNEQELGGLSAQFLGDLIDLQRKFGEIAELDTERAPVLLLRLSHQPGSSVRSGRLPLSEIVASPRQAASVA